MKNLNKEKVLEIVKRNKIKVAFMGTGGLLVLVLVLAGIVSLFGMGGNNYVSNASYDGGYYEKEMKNEMMDQGFAPPTMALSKNSRGISYDIMPYPGDLQVEGKYNNSTERKIIKNGNLSLVVKNIENSQFKIKQVVKNNSGFIAKSNFSENKSYRGYGENRKQIFSKSGYFEVKIPVENFEKVFVDLKNVALKVNNESISGNDVTEQFADLETQLKNKKAEVEQYRKILNKAVKIEDVLKVTKYLNNAQTQFEWLQGTMNRLSNQVEMSTIRVNIVSEKDIEVFGVTWSPLTELKQGFSNMVGDLKDFADDAIAFFFKLPIYILYIGGIILAGRIIWKLFLKLKKKVWEKKRSENEN